MNRVRSSHCGASLMELLTSMLFLSLVSALSYSFARAALMSARVQEAKSEVQEVTALAVDVLVRDVRMAGFSGAAVPLVGLRAAGRERIEVASDLNGDGDLADSNELIAYSYDAPGRQLMRATGGTSPQPLVRNVSGLTFGFFDANGTEILPLADSLTAEQRGRVRRVDVQLSAELPNPEPLANRPLTSMVTASLQLRNP